MHFAAYGRKSVYSDKSDSIDNQRRMCREYVDYRFKGQVETFEAYADEGLSGANTNRPELKRLLEDISDGLVDALVVYQIDRLSRNIRDFANIYTTLEEHRVKFVSVKENIDTATPIGKAMMYIISIFAQMERETIAARVKDNLEGLAKTGCWTGGNLPVGYTSRGITRNGKKHAMLEPDPEGIEYINRFFDRFLEEGRSMQMMVTALRKEGIRGKNGGFISVQSLHKLLTTPYCVKNTQEVYDYFADMGCRMVDDREKWDGTHGVMVYNRTTKSAKGHFHNPREKWAVCSGLHEPFMEPEKWLAVQAQLKVNTFNKEKKYPTTLLKGVLRCAKCGRLMRLQRRKVKGGISSSYICSKRRDEGKEACDMPNMLCRTLDDRALEIFREIEADAGVIKEYARREERPETDAGAVPKLEQQKRKIEGKIKRLADSLAEAEGSSAAKYIIKQIEEEDLNLSAICRNIEMIKREARKRGREEKTLEEKTAEITGFMKNFDRFDIEEQNRIVRGLVKKCTWDGEVLFLCF